ncbi:ATP synthase F1, epsilon subunit [uncultured Desulfatiglans sp.]|uniref:ATP synthase epsilon chain n=1 Tax=Uncultured Desulfatiglans sp. TaxID=1748965 RepID=A0A653AGD2_UNCDX|nr:ATP synthase F1, epsilon subunit [uncultured Desulfatiglans sp.]
MADEKGMRLRIHIPSGLFLDTIVRKITAEGPDGAFGILPRHLDLAAVLVPGILSYEEYEGGRTFMALDEGVLVKQGREVQIAVRMAVKGELGALKQSVEEMIAVVDDRERRTRSAVARLEADFVRRFVTFGKNA